MAPRILTLLRSPVTGISGGRPIRLQVACRVESWRKLASSIHLLEINDQTRILPLGTAATKIRG